MAFGEKLAFALVSASLAGCSPAPAEAPAPSRTPTDVRVLLDCPGDTSGKHQAILTELQPGQRVVINNRATDSSLEIDVQEGGAYAVWGATPRVRMPGEVFAASGNPYEWYTVVQVFAGEPEFIGRTPVWYNAGSAMTALCASRPVQSPYGYFVPAGAIQG